MFAFVQHSLTINGNALADNGINNCKAFDKFQFERIGFFSVDPDSSADRVCCCASDQLFE
jgi:glutaminyl-tRNA synthetase